MDESNDVSEPNWGLLPYKAREFFGLDSEFDRKALKRAYSKLIRRFKPERYPNEFQRIRAAFEQLENELRYGQPAISAGNSIEAYTWQADSKTPETAAAETAAAPQPTIRQRLQTEEPVAIYKELSAKQSKSPYEYFVLASLADVVTQDDTLYFKWLLTGLKDHRDDPGLFLLLQQFFKRDHKPALLQSLLLTTSKIVNHDRFYFLTEKSWQKLLNQMEFTRLKQLLARCEENLNDHRNRCQVVFYAEFLRAAIWVADPQWLEEKFRAIEGVSSHSMASQEFELLDILKEYHQQRDQLVGDSPARRQIDQAIRDYFMLEERDGDRAVVECQTSLANDAQSLLDAFPKLDGGQRLAPMMLLWLLINNDVSQRIGVELRYQSKSRKEKKRFADRVYSLISDLDETWQLGSRHVLMYYLFNAGSYLLLIIAPILLLSNWLGSTWAVTLCIALVVGGVVLNKLYLYPKTVEPIFHKYLHRTIERAYRQVWRGRFVQLFDATGATKYDLLPVMEHILVTDETFSGTTNWLVPLVASDEGLGYYSMATPYCR